MNTQAYPGQGLSLPQLIFALNEEIKLAMCCSSYVLRKSNQERHAHFLRSFTFDQVSQLDQDISTPLATIREWKNSFVCVNRIPLDILSLIPTYLTCDNDRLRASFVCRLWRRTFLQRADLWSQLSLSKGEASVKTFLERAKGSGLSVSARLPVPDDIMALVSSHIKQIKSLDFVGNVWEDINRFPEINFGSFPLLHTLAIDAHWKGDLPSPGPRPTLFGGARNLKVLRVRSLTSSLGRLLFPNLTCFTFSDAGGQPSHVSHLLDFLEASPTLRTVSVAIAAHISFEGIHLGRTVVLPKVEGLTLVARGGRIGYKVATHLSCPSAIHTSLTYNKGASEKIQEGVFPTSVSLNTIVRRYTRSPVEAVLLCVETFPASKCNFMLKFQSSDTTTITFCCKASSAYDIFTPSNGTYYQLLAQTTRTIQNHPHLASIKHLRICHGVSDATLGQISHIANEAGRLFKCLGPLDELTIYSCDLRPYLHAFLDLPDCHVKVPVVFPQVKQLTISHPKGRCDEECQTAIVVLAMSQRVRRIPFERVVIRLDVDMLGGMEEKLRKWVGSVECHFNRLKLNSRP